MMDLYSLIGKKLSHSFSPDYFNNKFKTHHIDAVYKLFEIQDISELPELINSHRDLKGLNVTIPYKKEVMPYLDYIDDTAAKLGAVNTIRVDWKGNRPVLYGYNTDVIGFEQSLHKLIRSNNINTALILGTGGSAQSVAFVLSKLKIDYHFVSRGIIGKDILNYNDLNGDIITKSNLIINTTPAGMYPQIDDSPPIPYQFLSPQHLLFDLIYNPDETVFLKKGLKRGASISNGMEMLELQAEASWVIWQNC